MIIVVVVVDDVILGLWIYAMGCSLLVSLASLICLILLPLIFCELIVFSIGCNMGLILVKCTNFCKFYAVQGKPSKVLVDSLALFGVSFLILLLPMLALQTNKRT